MNLVSKSVHRTNLTPRGITVLLRSPSHQKPLQRWTFNDQPVIKIGRCGNNHIVLHSSVVSRSHVEMRWMGTQWKLINFSNNHTYVDHQAITEIIVTDAMIIRLAISGPQLQILLSSSLPQLVLKKMCYQKLAD